MQIGSGSYSVDGTTKYGVNVEDAFYGGSSTPVSPPQIFQQVILTTFVFTNTLQEQTIISLTLPPGLPSSKIQATGYAVVAPNNNDAPRVAYSGSFGLTFKKNGNYPPLPQTPIPVVTFAPGPNNENFLTLPVSLSFTAQGGDTISIVGNFEPTNASQKVRVNNSYIQIVTGFA